MNRSNDNRLERFGKIFGVKPLRCSISKVLLFRGKIIWRNHVIWIRNSSLYAFTNTFYMLHNRPHSPSHVTFFVPVTYLTVLSLNIICLNRIWLSHIFALSSEVAFLRWVLLKWNILFYVGLAKMLPFIIIFYSVANVIINVNKIHDLIFFCSSNFKENNFRKL